MKRTGRPISPLEGTFPKRKVEFRTCDEKSLAGGREILLTKAQDRDHTTSRRVSYFRLTSAQRGASHHGSRVCSSACLCMSRCGLRPMPLCSSRTLSHWLRTSPNVHCMVRAAILIGWCYVLVLPWSFGVAKDLFLTDDCSTRGAPNAASPGSEFQNGLDVIKG